VTEEFLEFGQGAGQSDIAPGTYRVTLTEISDVRTQTAKRGPNAGQDFSIRDWTFFTDDDKEIRDSASISRSSRSKQYEWVTALLGGTAPALDQKLAMSQLIGREAIATIELNEDGWPKIRTLSAIPQERAKPANAASPAAAARARAGTPQPAAAAAAGDDLPF
jgi:hypothetical protein